MSWAAAATLYSMLTGFAPRRFSRDRDVWRTVLQDPPVPIRQRVASIPRRLAEVIDEALGRSRRAPVSLDPSVAERTAGGALSSMGQLV